MANKTISNTFVVNTVDDPVGLVAQYCATATPTQSSQIHTSFQTGDLYMRTRTTEETFSGYVDPNHPWNKIVGESGGETNYQFAISANKVSQDGTSATAPTDISSSDWQDAPLIVTTAKPYLWSKVQKKDGGGNNVGNPSYMRLTGEESIEYSVEGALNTIKVGAGQTTTMVNCTYTFYQKPAVSSTRSTVSCYYAVYLRSGNTFSLLTMGTGYNNHGSGTSVTVSSNVPYKSGSIVYNAVVIYIFPSSYYSTSPESQNYMAKKEIPIVKDGDTAFVVDLENEMTNVALDENGNLIANFDMYFKVRAYYGTTNVLSDSACSVSASCSNPNVTITDTNAKTTGIRVQISSGTHILDTTEVSVTVTHTTYGTRTVIFTLAGVRGGENAVLQELLPSLDAISFARTASGGLTPSSRDLTLSIKKTQGGSTSTQSISDSGLTIRWSSTSMPASKTGGNGWGNGTATGIYFNNTTMQIANTVAATNIYIAAFNSAGTLVDRETIPVIKDGEKGEKGDKGDDALTLALDTYAISFPTDSDYNVGSALTYTVGVKMFLGNNTQQTITSISPTSSDEGVTVSSISNGVRIVVGEERFVNSITVTVTAVCAKGTRTAKIILTAAPKGAKGDKGNDGIDGARGKVGRFFYFGGTFDSLNTTQTFIVNDAQAPYFEHTVGGQKRYHVFNYETNGSYTMSQMWAISSNWNNKPWEVMTSDFKYLITEALFADFAKLGSGVFNKDWLFSAYGNAVSALYSGYGSSSQYTYRDVLTSQTSLPVNMGDDYEYYITWYASSSTPTLYAEIYYSTNNGSSWTGGRPFISTSKTSSATDTLRFKAEYTGLARLYFYGYGTITKIMASSSLTSDYQKFTPAFVNREEQVLLNNGFDVSFTSYTNVANTQLDVHSGVSYKLYVKAQTGSSTLYLRIYDINNSRAVGSTLSISPSSTSGTITVTATYTSKVVVQAYIVSGNRVINYVSITPINNYVPKTAIDWMSGYAHFGGDSVHFNPNGSGWLAKKNIEWNENGNLDVTGALNVKNSSNVIKVKINGDDFSKTSGEDITIVDVDGIYVKRGNDGFRLTTNGFQRWNSTADSWVNFYGGRYVRTVTSFTYTIKLNDDLIIAKPSSSGQRAYLPSSGVPDGKIITIINAGYYGLYVNGNGHDIIGASVYGEVTLNINDRMEFIYSSDKWYANFMPKVDNNS